MSLPIAFLLSKLWAKISRKRYVDTPEATPYEFEKDKPVKNYNQVMNQPVGDYMIELTMQRMEKVEAVLESCHSEWARQHWSQVLEYFRRQLKLMEPK